jgi:phosphoribosylaminoimidazole (AIR) synthetase
LLGKVNSEIVKVTDENVQKEIDINSEVLGIVNGEIVKVTDKYAQKEIDINAEVLGIVNSEITSDSMIFLSINLFSFNNSRLHFDRFSKSCGAGFTTSNSALKRLA